MRFNPFGIFGQTNEQRLAMAKALQQQQVEQKSSTVSPLIYLMYQGQVRGVYTKRNYAQYSDDAYKRCVIAYRCINIISRGAAKVPWKAVRGANGDRGGTPLPPNHPLNKLLRRPNPFQSEAWFREAMAAYLLLSGNSYVEGVGPFKEGSPPLELWPLRPDRTRVVPGATGPKGYVYEVNGQVKNFSVDDQARGPVLHLKFFNPLDDWYGMSPVEAAAYAVDAHNMAGEWNQGLLQNGCRPSGAIVYKPSDSSPPNLSDRQRDSIKEELNAAQAGTRNAGRPMILEGGLEWQQMSLNPSEMDWINGKNNSAREICNAFDVPPMILGIPGDNTYSNYQEARQALYQDTILPLNDSFIDSLNAWLCPLFGEGITIQQDVQHLPALSGVRQQQWASVVSSNWMTTNEKREATGFEPLDDEAADEVLIPSSLVPLTGINEPMEGNEQLDENGEPQEEVEEDPAEEAEEDPAEETTEDAGGEPAQKPTPPKKPSPKPQPAKKPNAPKQSSMDELLTKLSKVVTNAQT